MQFTGRAFITAEGSPGLQSIKRCVFVFDAIWGILPLFDMETGWGMMYIKDPQYQTRYSVVTWYASLPVHYTPDMSHSLINFKIHSTLC